MGSPAIFNGKFTKLLTNKGILNSDGSLNQFDGAKNYIPYAQFEQGATTGWSLFNTTLTSGLPTGSVTAGASSLALTATSTNPLSGSYSMQLAAGTSWTAGQGVISSAFTVDRADLGKVLTFKFYYEATAGATNANWSGILGSQSLAVYIYDVTASAWVQPAGFLGMNQNSGAGYVTGTFQTSVTSGQQYQIAIVALQAVANPLTITVDQVYVGPQTAPIGAVVTDWQSYGSTSSYTGFGTVTSNTQFWRRVGDSIEILCKFIAGTGTAVEARIALPTGLTSADTTKIPSISIAGSFGGTSNSYHNTVTIEPSVSYITFALQNGTGSTFTKLQGTAFSGQTISVIAKFAIQGWSSNLQTSDTNDTRVVAATISGTPASWLANGIVIFPTVQTDSYASYSVSTGRYSVPVSGWYQISCWVGTNNFPNNIALYKDASLVSIIGAGYASVTGGSSGASGGAIVYANAGQLLDIRSSTSSGTPSASYLSINRLSGPSVLAATDTVAASYYCSANGTATTTTPINFDSKEFDSTNSVTVGSGWKFTAPISGTYLVTLFSNQTTGSSSYYLIYKNSTSAAYKAVSYTPSTVGLVTGSTSLKLNAGDYIGIYTSVSTGYQGNASLATGSTSHISITRTGN